MGVAVMGLGLSAPGGVVHEPGGSGRGQAVEGPHALPGFWLWVSGKGM